MTRTGQYWCVKQVNKDTKTTRTTQLIEHIEIGIEIVQVVAVRWKMTSADLCEIGRNSVLQSGFEHVSIASIDVQNIKLTEFTFRT